MNSSVLWTSNNLVINYVYATTFHKARAWEIEKEEQKSIIIAQQILFSFYMFSILKTQCTFEDHNLKAMNW